MIKVGSTVYLRTNTASFLSCRVTRLSRNESVTVTYMKNRSWDSQLQEMAEEWPVETIPWKDIDKLVELV